MLLSVTKSEDRAKIDLGGIIDEEGAETLKKSFSELSLPSMKEVVLDMNSVKHIGSTGIGKILLFYKNLGVNGGKLKIINLQASIYDLFLELKLDSLFEISKG